MRTRAGSEATTKCAAVRRGIGTAAILAAALVLAEARPARAGTLAADRHYVPVETVEDETFVAFWSAFRGAVSHGSTEDVAGMTSFPLPFRSRCLAREEFVAQYKSVFFTEAVDALVGSPLFLSSHLHPGEYYAVLAQYRDADEGQEELYEFSRVDGGFRLSRVGLVDGACEPSKSATSIATPEPAPKAAPEPAPEPTEAPLPPPTRVAHSRTARQLRPLVALAAYVVYSVVAFRLCRVLIARRPRLRFVPNLLGCLLLAAAVVVVWYVPAGKPRHLWSDVFDALLVLVGAAIALLALPLLLAGLKPCRRTAAH